LLIDDIVCFGINNLLEIWSIRSEYVKIIMLYISNFIYCLETTMVGFVVIAMFVFVLQQRQQRSKVQQNAHLPQAPKKIQFEHPSIFDCDYS